MAPPTRDVAPPPSMGRGSPLGGRGSPPLQGMAPPPRGVAPWGLQVVLWRSHQQTGPGSSPIRSQPHCGAAESRGKAMPLSF